MRILNATEGYATAIATLEGMLFPEECVGERLLAITLRQGGSLVALSEEQTVVGYVLGREVCGLFDVLRIGVVPHAQGFGVGSELLRAAIRHRPKSMLAVYKTNTRALAWYQRCGFNIVGTKGEHWVMRRTTSDGVPAVAAR